MKKLFAGIITCATILLTGIGVSAAAADENNSGDENVQSEIVFVWNGFDECYVGNTDNPPGLYKGFFVEKNGNIRSFSFEDVDEHWTFGYISMEDIPKTISLNKTTPQEKLLSHLTDVSKYQIIGKLSEEELERNLYILSNIDTNVNIKMGVSPLDVVQGYSETFGLRYDDNGKAEVVFLNGMGTIINRHTDENALEIDSWIRNLDISSDNPNTETTHPNLTENTKTTTVTTTENTPNSDTTTISTDNTESTITTTETTTTTATNDGGIETITTIAAPANIASDEELCDWAAKDYAEKTGITPENAEIEYIADGNAVITLTDAEGSVLDVYNIDPFTGIGTEADGGDVNLPQTGYSNFYKVIVWFAILMTISGVAIVAYSRKESE